MRTHKRKGHAADLPVCHRKSHREVHGRRRASTDAAQLSLYAGLVMDLIHSRRRIPVEEETVDGHPSISSDLRKDIQHR